MTEATAALTPQQMREQTDAEAYRVTQMAEAAEQPQVNRGWRKALKWGLIVGGVGLVAALFANPLLAGLGAIAAKGGAAIASGITAAGGSAAGATAATGIGIALENMIVGSTAFATAAAGSAALGGLTTAAVAGGRELVRGI